MTTAESLRERQRFRPNEAISTYRDGLSRFAALSSAALRDGGFLAMVVGQPVADSFSSVSVFEMIDDLLAKVSINRVWTTMRRINWHRNHGYARLHEERVAVYVRSRR